MSSKIPCEVIQDLFPSYLDGLTSDVTKKVIEEHIANCVPCSAVLNRMKTPEEPAGTQTSKEIDYLRKVKKTSAKRITTSIVVTIALLLLAAVVKLFVIGFPTSAYSVDTVSKNGVVTINGHISDAAFAFNHSKLLDTNEGKMLQVYVCLVSPWNHEKSFSFTYQLDDIRSDVLTGDVQILSDGFVISDLANRLYDAKNPYIGNMPANGELAAILGVHNLGPYLNELQTTHTPYGWTFEFQNPVRASDEEFFNSKMTAYAYTLLALIDNAGEITWTYPIKTATDIVHKQSTVTQQQADEKLGADVKSFAQSARNVQELISRLMLDA